MLIQDPIHVLTFLSWRHRSVTVNRVLAIDLNDSFSLEGLDFISEFEFITIYALSRNCRMEIINVPSHVANQ